LAISVAAARAATSLMALPDPLYTISSTLRP